MGKTLVGALIFLTSCSAPSIYLVNPRSGEVKECYSGRMSRTTSLVAQAVNRSEIERCAEQFEALGYVRADKLTPEQRENLNVTHRESKTVVAEPQAPRPVVVSPPNNNSLHCTSTGSIGTVYTHCY
jgi:hypothetical protein